jgi:hypothetical protein
VIEIKVEHGVTMNRGAAYKPCEVPFSKLGVGDSFFVACDNALEVQKKAQWMRNQAKKYRKESGHRDFGLTISVQEAGFRVWRVA